MIGTITPQMSEAYNLFHEGTLALADAEFNGMRIDIDYCKRTDKRLGKKIKRAEKELINTKLGSYWGKIYGTKTNFNSDTQLRNILFNKMKLKAVSFTDKGLEATDEEALTGFKLEGLPSLIKRRKYSKTKETYIGGMLREQVNGILHPFFDLVNPVSYRGSSSHINF